MAKGQKQNLQFYVKRIKCNKFETCLGIVCAQSVEGLLLRFTLRTEVLAVMRSVIGYA